MFMHSFITIYFLHLACVLNALPFSPLVFPCSDFSHHTRHSYLAYLTYLCISSLFCLYLSLCVTVWRFVLCSVHAIPGSRPDGPRLRRNVKGPRNPMSISIKYVFRTMLCNSGWQGSAAFERLASHFEPNRKNKKFAQPRSSFPPNLPRRGIIQNESSSDNQSILEQF